MLIDSMTDRELMQQFEGGTLPHEHFHHRQHVRTAFLYVTHYPLMDGLLAFSAVLKRMAAARGKPQAYHETITWAYMFLIHERIARAGKKQCWDDFARDNSDLLEWKDGALARYYCPETLASDLARKVFVFPDRCI